MQTRWFDPCIPLAHHLTGLALTQWWAMIWEREVMVQTAKIRKRDVPPLLTSRDPRWIARILPWVRLFNRYYLRLRVEGFDQLPPGPALLVGNHNGGIAGPDLACTLGTLWEIMGAERPLYALAHDFAMRQCKPFGAVLQKFGALRADPESALVALRAGAKVLVYPGGDLDAYRHFVYRNRVIFGTRTGFVRVAQQAGVPIVPIVAAGAHRSAFIFTEGETIARVIRLKRWGRLERFPLALALPWGLAVGPWIPYLPLPFPIRLRMLAPIWVKPVDDVVAVRESVRERMQAAIDEMVGAHVSPR